MDCGGSLSRRSQAKAEATAATPLSRVRGVNGFAFIELRCTKTSSDFALIPIRPHQRELAQISGSILLRSIRRLRMPLKTMLRNQNLNRPVEHLLFLAQVRLLRVQPFPCAHGRTAVAGEHPI